MPIGTYVGRSCPTVPPLRDVMFRRPARSVLEAAVPAIDDRSLACVSKRLQNAQPLRIVFFGSSVTAGIRCKHTKQRSVNFPQQLQQLLEARYPLANVTIDVYGYPGASPSFMHACASTLMRTDGADMYVLEMTDNLSDGYAGVGKSIEALMAAVHERAPSAALVLLAPIPQRCVRALKRMKPFQHVPKTDASTTQILVEDCYSNSSVAASFEDVGAAHGITTISARHLVKEALFGNLAGATSTIGRYHYDAVHPNGAGHWELALALEHAIVRRAGTARIPSALQTSFCEPRLAGSLERANVFAPRQRPAGSMVCALGEDLQHYIVRASGWKFTVERNAQGLPKPGYIAVEPGATLDLCYRPDRKRSNKGMSNNVAVAWSLGYLMSYEHMGRARGECLGRGEGSSCTCGSRVFDAHWRLPVSQPHISRLKLLIHYARHDTSGSLVPEAARGMPDPVAAAAACPCTIRLTLLNETSSDAKKFKLVSLMSGFYTGTIVSDAVGWAARYGVM